MEHLFSAILLVCFNLQSALMSLKISENVVHCQTAWIRARRRVTHCLIIRSKLFAYGALVVIGGLRVNDNFPHMCQHQDLSLSGKLLKSL